MQYCFSSLITVNSSDLALKNVLKEMATALGQLKYEITEMRKDINIFKETFQRKMLQDVQPLASMDFGFPLKSIEELKELDKKCEAEESFKNLVR